MSITMSQVKGIGPATEGNLAAAGFTTVKSLADATLEQLIAVPGFGNARANQVIEHARQLLVQTPTADEGAASGDAIDVADEKPKEKKKEKSGKKKDKKKKEKAKKEKSKKEKPKKKDQKKKSKKKKSKKKAKKKASK